MARKGENIYKRKDGRWEARYIFSYEESGKAKYKYLYARTYREVKLKLSKALSSNISSNQYSKESEQYSYWLNEWLMNKKISVKESTFIRYRNTIEKHIKPELGKYPISKISSSLVEQFTLNKLENGRIDGKGGLSPKSMSDILVIIKESFRYAQSYGAVTICSFERINFKKPPKEMRVLSLAEEKRLLTVLPFCYSYDKFPISNNDLSRIVNVLIDYPNCAVSMQLLPTILDANEIAEIDRITQALDTLSKGVMDQGIGNVSFALAEKHADVYRYYSENKTSALFAFNVLIYGDNSAISNVSSRVFGQLSTGSNTSSNLKMVALSSAEVGKDNNFYPLPWAVNEVLVSKDRNNNLWGSGQFSNALYRLPYVITSEEAAEFFRLPIGSDRISAGLKINESGKGNKTYSANIINSGDITVGKLRSSSNGDSVLLWKI